MTEADLPGVVAGMTVEQLRVAQMLTEKQIDGPYFLLHNEVLRELDTRRRAAGVFVTVQEGQPFVDKEQAITLQKTAKVSKLAKKIGALYGSTDQLVLKPTVIRSSPADTKVDVPHVIGYRATPIRWLPKVEGASCPY